MIEKVVTLENISMLDFLGMENKTIDTLTAAFPKSKIVSRGNQIFIKGPTAEIVQIDDVINSLVDHYHTYGRVTEENVQAYIDREQEIMLPESQQVLSEDVIIYGAKGVAIKPKTSIRKNWFNSLRIMILCLRLGPLEQGKRTSR